MASQAGSYGALLVGGVLVAAAFSGRPVRDILAGKTSPIKGLVSEPPDSTGASVGGTSLTSFSGASASSGGTNSGGGGVKSSGVGAAKAVEWAKGVVGVSGGSGAVARWDAAIGSAPGIPWCSAFVSAALRQAGVKNLPSNPAYSGSWLSWKGGKNIGTSLANAKPGDLLIFDWGDGGITDHVALYAGNHQMISGNDSNDKVGTSSVPTGNLVGIVRPKYPRTSLKHTLGFKTVTA